MAVQIRPWQKALGLALIGLFILATLIKPLISSLYTYLKYHSIARQQQYVNATVTKVETKTPTLIIFGHCYVAVQYRFSASGKSIQSSDNLNCKYKDNVGLGNTLPVYYDQHHPSSAVSTFALATNSKQLTDTVAPGLIGTILIIGLWYVFRKPQSSNPLQDYT